MAIKQPPLFEDRFLESYAGQQIIQDPRIAIVELVANAWDAGATSVYIEWPENNGDRFSICDDGHGMSQSDFEKRFRMLSYNRRKQQGEHAEIPNAHRGLIGKRPVFGRNGKGRWGSFAFAEPFYVKTWRDNIENTFLVARDQKNLMYFQKLGDSEAIQGQGTQIYAESAVKPLLSAEDARKEIGMRFLADPNFKIFLNGEEVSFEDLPVDNTSIIEFELENIG